MSSASNILKMLVGIVILIIGIIWYVPKSLNGLGFLTQLIDLLKATIGLVLLFVGLIVAWMGYDDYKMDKEMAKEEKKEEPKKE
jgi:membrane-bound ClpP family serine protease